MEIGEIETFAATKSEPFSTIGRTRSFNASLASGTNVSTCAAVVVVGLIIYAVSVTHFLTSWA